MIKKLLLEWLLSKPMMGAFNLSSNNTYWQFYDMSLIKHRFCDARSKTDTNPFKRDEVLNSYPTIDLYKSKDKWSEQGFEFESFTLITHGKEMFYFIYKQLDEKGKNEFLSVIERLLPFERMLQILKNDKEVFANYMNVTPKAFSGLLTTNQIDQLLKILRSHYTDASYEDLLYNFLLNRKRQLARLEVQSMANSAVNLYVKDKTRFQEFFPDITGDDYFMPSSTVVSLKISKSLFYNLITSGIKPVDKSVITNYLNSFIFYMDRKEKKRLFLNHASLLNTENATKHYIVVLDCTEKSSIDYEDMLETVMMMCREKIGLYEERHEHFKKSLDHYFLEKSLPPKEKTATKINKI